MYVSMIVLPFIQGEFFKKVSEKVKELLYPSTYFSTISTSVEIPPISERNFLLAILILHVTSSTTLQFTDYLFYLIVNHYSFPLSLPQKSKKINMVISEKPLIFDTFLG
jgi:hypothetical protein